ncbi:MAG TPA: histidinol phosphate phosphatase domain-containing protein [Chloroflexota bacterium]|nr:histidinol phosphate phosphatase domain-containing protein [Chloroflexota bacterium]
MLYDFHTHSFLSDGVLSPVELIRRAHVAGYAAVAVTDHAGPGNLELVLDQLKRECALASRHWPIVAVPGVELTHIPAASVDELARLARQAGAQLVVVHGETVAEPVEPGTNRAAVDSEHVDVLAHPGLLSAEDAARAAARGCFVEISGRKGHAFANGHVVRTGLAAGVAFLLDSDAHQPEELLTESFALKVLRGAAVPESEIATILEANPRALLERVGQAG